MAKYNFYAVGHGIDPDTGEIITGKIYKTWDECKKCIINVTDAKYKGFLTMSEANVWLQQFEKHIDDSIVNECKKVSKTYTKNNVDKRFSSICKDINVDEKEILNMLKEQFIQTYSFLSKE